MTEREWLECDSLISLHNFPGTSPRKLYLFVAAVRPLFVPEVSCSKCRALSNEPEDDLAILFANSRLSGEKCKCGYFDIFRFAYYFWDGDVTWPEFWNRFLDVTCGMRDQERVRRYRQSDVSDLQAWLRKFRDEQGRREADALYLFKEIVGNPFRRLALPREWLVWDEALIPTLASAIYADRRFEEMPVLGDALEDAGCTDAALLHHLRGPGRHVRGCWALDLILGKQ